MFLPSHFNMCGNFLHHEHRCVSGVGAPPLDIQPVTLKLNRSALSASAERVGQGEVSGVTHRVLCTWQLLGLAVKDHGWHWVDQFSP